MRKTMLVTVQGKKMMCHAECIVLTNNQYEKLTCNGLAKRVDGLAKDFHVDWSIECNGNVNVINITRTTTATIDDAFCHKLEMDATNFMSAIDKLELPDKKEPECPSHDQESDNEEKEKAKQFVFELLSNTDLPIEHERHIIGAQILCTGPMDIPFPLPWGRMSRRLIKEMCQLYLAAHEND